MKAWHYKTKLKYVHTQPIQFIANRIYFFFVYFQYLQSNWSLKNKETSGGSSYLSTITSLKSSQNVEIHAIFHSNTYWLLSRFFLKFKHIDFRSNVAIDNNNNRRIKSIPFRLWVFLFRSMWVFLFRQTFQIGQSAWQRGTLVSNWRHLFTW